MQKLYDGFRIRGKGLTPTVIMSLVVERLLKGNDEPITFSELVSATSDTKEGVLEALRLLEKNGWLNVEGSWEEIGSFAIDSFSVSLQAEQMVLPELKPQSENLGIPKAPRLEDGKDEKVVGDLMYLGTVTYDGDTGRGCYTLKIETHPKANKHADREPYYVADFATKERAWEVFDNIFEHDTRESTDEQELTAPDGTKWRAIIEAVFDDNPADPENPSGFNLQIFRTLTGEGTSTLVVEDRFDTMREAWDYVDEYIGVEARYSDRPSELPEAEEPVALEVVEGTPADVSGTDEGISWRYFGEAKCKPARFEFDLPTGIQIETAWDENTPIGEVAKSFIAAYLGSEVPA